MADLVSMFAVASGVMSTIGSMLKTAQENKNYESKVLEALYNAKQFRNDAQMAFYEKAMAFNQQLAKGRQDIATGVGAMVAAGNYGTSAQAQVFGSALNIMKDLSAIQYRYDNEAIQAENQARIQEYNAEQYKNMKKGGASTLLGSLISGVTSAGNSYLRGVEVGAWKPFWDK